MKIPKLKEIYLDEIIVDPSAQAKDIKLHALIKAYKTIKPYVIDNEKDKTLSKIKDAISDIEDVDVIENTGITSQPTMIEKPIILPEDKEEEEEEEIDDEITPVNKEDEDKEILLGGGIKAGSSSSVSLGRGGPSRLGPASYPTANKG